ncbi:hypothetical protein WMF30_51450 [Sorangium sp. So ce134]
MARILVLPQVFADDVVAGVSAGELAQLEDRLATLIERTPDADDPQAVRILRALMRPPLLEGPAWSEPYQELGLEPRWLDIVKRLRIRSRDDYCQVWELVGEVPDTTWIERDGVLTRADPDPADEAPRLSLYTLRLSATVPRDGDTRKPGAPESPPPPVRPLGSRRSDLGEVEALADFLAPRVEATFNGTARLREQPLLAPLCTLAATVWTAMQHPKARTKHKDPQYRKGAFYACLDGLALGEHHAAAERILRRDHPRHIHVDASAAPERYTARTWRSGLGMFAEGKDGHLTAVNDGNRKQFTPTILLSLSGDEPW